MTAKYKLGVLTTHPIQYQAPLFRALAKEPCLDLTVLYCMIPDAVQQGVGFGVPFRWDIPLLGGYRHIVLGNDSRKPSPSSFRGCDTPGIRKAIQSEGFDVVLALGWQVMSYLQLLVACRRLGVPCMVRGESNDVLERPVWKRLIHRMLLLQYGAMLYIGESNRRFYLANGVPESKLHFAPYCVDNERFAAAAASVVAKRAEVRERWGIPQRATTFLYCGKFVPKKRPVDCLRALRVALDSGARANSEIHLLMVGSGDLLRECQAEASRYALPVTFAGFLNQREIALAYAAADCLVLASDHGETWGLVVNEAMACGLPAIVSDRVGCHFDLVTNGETGHVFEMGDAHALGELMAGMVADPQRLREMGTNARGRVARYCYAEVVRGVVEAVNAVQPGRSSQRQSR